MYDTHPLEENHYTSNNYSRTCAFQSLFQYISSIRALLCTNIRPFPQILEYFVSRGKRLPINHTRSN